jgi:hypothetical protein
MAEWGRAALEPNKTTTKSVKLEYRNSHRHHSYHISDRRRFLINCKGNDVKVEKPGHFPC